MALGYPRTLSAQTIGIATQGIVSGSDDTGLLVLDLIATHGSSGGPVFNRSGEVLGLLKFVQVSGDPFTYAADLTGLTLSD